jgi:adenosylcobyric acid synthase
MSRALMFQGTGSGVGKSVIAAGFCRLLKNRGYQVRPYKSQNMALNSGVTPDGLEIGRAQIVQALACGVEPDARMNPILLKPQGPGVSQLIRMGKVVQTCSARNTTPSLRKILRLPQKQCVLSGRKAIGW